MLTWIKQQLSQFWLYLVAPILFHAKTDGVIMSTYFILSEVTEAYGLLLVGLLFVSALVLYRNKLLSVFNPAVKTVMNRISNVGGYLNPLPELKQALARVKGAIRKFFR